ncbi:hypothetical protein HMPREF9441_03877 [Paraprevotella clara YIT 11840]|uniref:Uncharacterized protein n=1 Tax=Paraprevotella clara YIT 11840 TaxID=762968 RepID=G5SWV4_9BACT|nr:hypothetical protein HMPREF9441_03877 [Paraprevotella clara YIT 11840]
MIVLRAFCTMGYMGQNTMALIWQLENWHGFFSPHIVVTGENAYICAYI